MFNEYWLNSNGRAFVKELPANWRNRIQLLFNGKALKVYTLGRSDLIFTKILAELDRQEDMEDIFQLDPSVQELSNLEEHLLNLENNNSWKSKVAQIIKLLKTREK